jgi:hypothetical protein
MKDKIIEMKTTLKLLKVKAFYPGTNKEVLPPYRIEVVSGGLYASSSLSGISTKDEVFELRPETPTLNRDKVVEVLEDVVKECFRLKNTMDNKINLLPFADALCSLSLPTLSEGEIREKAAEYSKEVNELFGGILSVRERSFMINGYEAAIKDLTKPK